MRAPPDSREEIDWALITFPDNGEVVELIDGKRPPGMLALLDEQCLMPKVRWRARAGGGVTCRGG